MKELEYPRILVVTTNNFNLIGGGGITLTNLFRGWPADRIANLHEDSTPEDQTVCREFFRLTGDEIRYAWPFSALHLVLPPSQNGTTALGAPGPDSRLLHVSRLIVGDGIPRTAHISDRLEKWLDAFRPELMYSFLGSMAQIRLTEKLARVRNIPIAIHMMDDWPSVLYRRGFLSPVFRRTVLREFRRALDRAALRLGISDAMCVEYKRRYGFAFRPFHNTIDVEQWMRTSRTTWQARMPFRLSYVGSIVPDAQQNALREVCLAVRDIRRTGFPIEMHICSPREQSSYLETEELEGAVHFMPPPDNTKIGEILASADALLLPFDFEPHSAEYMRLSMPTKIPAYMISGTPILVYGPASIGAVDFAHRQGWAHVVSSPDRTHLLRTLRGLATDAFLREQLGRRAMTLAADLYDASRVRPSFHAALAAAAYSGSLHAVR